MENNNLTINGIDHSVFDVELAHKIEDAEYNPVLAAVINRNGTAAVFIEPTFYLNGRSIPVACPEQLRSLK